MTILDGKFGGMTFSLYFCPRIHLTDELTDEQLRFVTLIEPMYIEARYPEQKLDAAKMLNKDASLYILQSTKELIQWIEKRLQENRL